MYMYVKFHSRNLNLDSCPHTSQVFILVEYLYLWSDHRTKDIWWCTNTSSVISLKGKGIIKEEICQCCNLHIISL